jgi:uncharacterized protein
MKKTAIFVLLGLIANTALLAQNTDIESLKKIIVVGSAEMEIVPDEIFLSISLQEYKTNKNDKVEIRILENQLAEAVKDAGIDSEDFQIENVYGWNKEYWYKKKKQNEEFLAKKQYRLKLSDLLKVNDILDAMDPDGIEFVNISDYSHSAIEEYRKELKIKAIQAAKDKAEYLLQAIGEEPGEALEIQEVEMGSGSPYYGRSTANAVFDAGRGQGSNADIGFKKIKLQYKIRASFMIK